MDARRIVALAILFGGCDQLLGGGGERDRDRVGKLEARVAVLEAQLKQKQDESTGQKGMLDLCLARAEDSYWDYVKLNGRPKGKPDQNGEVAWNAPVAIFDHAAKTKQNAIEECRIRYGGK